MSMNKYFLISNQNNVNEIISAYTIGSVLLLTPTVFDISYNLL